MHKQNGIAAANVGRTSAADRTATLRGNGAASLSLGNGLGGFFACAFRAGRLEEEQAK